MKTKQVLFNMVLLAAFLVSACSGTATPTTDAMMAKETPTPDVMMQSTADAMMSKETPTPDAMMQSTADAMMSEETPTADAMMQPTADAMMSGETPTADAMMESPAWYSASFTDASTGKVFSINDFKGKVILVEAMAVSCSDCKKQQIQVKALHGLLGERDDFVSLSLDVDLKENASDLKEYVKSNNFDWLYAVATTDIAQDLSKYYGNQFLDLSSPMLVIDHNGEAHPIPFGLKSADELMKFIQPFLDGSM